MLVGTMLNISCISNDTSESDISWMVGNEDMSPDESGQDEANNKISRLLLLAVRSMNNTLVVCKTDSDEDSAMVSIMHSEPSEQEGKGLTPNTVL